MSRLVLASVLLAACASAAPPVPLTGAGPALAALTGEWHGEYHLRGATARQGNIFFRLDADADSAIGDVMMISPPRELSHRPGMPGFDPWSGVGPETEMLSIRFVHAAGDSVAGALNPYRDPDCGCTLRTTFVGRLHGDTITGSFRSLHLEMGETVDGWWQVHRTHE